MTTTALILGGADCLHDDIKAYDGPVDGVVACNEAGAEWPGKLDAWVSLHARYFQQKKWRRMREDNGYPEALRHVGHHNAKRGHHKHIEGLTPDLIYSDYDFVPNGKGGSSGMFAAKFALVDLGFDRAVLCGIPLTETPHFFDANKEPWKSAEAFRKAWLKIPPEYLTRMRSQSGWTRVLLGEPWK